MFGLRASAKRLRDIIASARFAPEKAAASPAESAAMIAHAIYHRERAGRTTSLRQLHRITELKQPEALRIVRALERDGMLVVACNEHDALESQVALTGHMRERLSDVLRGTAA